jgi:hypothetical protein
MILNMFRGSLCSSSGGQLYIYSTWYRHTLYAAIQCTKGQLYIYSTWYRHTLYAAIQSVTIPDTVNIRTIVLLKMSTAILETC